MKKIIKLVLIIAALAGMTGMVSCANGSSDDSPSVVTATKKTTTVKIGDTEYVYTTTDDKVNTSDKVTVADDGSITVKADDGSKITVSKDGKTITYTDKNGKEYTGAFAEETTLKNSDGSEVKATTRSKSETVSADSVNVELPASVGVNELAGKSKTQSDRGYKETFSFDESYYTYTKDTTVVGGGVVEKSIYRYSYDSTKKLVYLVKIKGIHNDKKWTNAAGYKSKIKSTTDFLVERERVEFSTVQAYKYSFDSNSDGFLTHYFTGSMPTLASFGNGDLSLWGCRLSKNNTYLQTLTFTDGTSGTFKGETGITGTYSVEGSVNKNSFLPYRHFVIFKSGIVNFENFVSGEWIYEVTETTKTENENGKEIKYSVYTNKAGNTVVTKYFDSSDESSYKVTYTGGEYTVKYDKNTEKFTVIHSDGTTKTFENIEKVYLSEDFSFYIIEYNSETSHVYSGKDGTQKDLDFYRLNLTFNSIPAGISLTANKTYTLY